MVAKKKAKKKMSFEAMDMAGDKRMGLKENSKKDLAMDAKQMKAKKKPKSKK